MGEGQSYRCDWSGARFQAPATHTSFPNRLQMLECKHARGHRLIGHLPTHIYLYTQSCARKALTATKWDEVLPVTGLERHVGTPNPTSSSASHDHKTNGKHVHGRCLGRNGYGTNYIRCCSKCAHTLAQNKLEDEPGIRIPYSGCRKKKETNHNQYIYISIYMYRSIGAWGM